MSDEPTRRMPANSFEERVLSELAAIRAEQSAQRAEMTALRGEVAALDGRMTTLEEKVDRRLQETRPIWEAVQTALEDIQWQFRELARELFAQRARISRIEDRDRPPLV